MVSNGINKAVSRDDYKIVQTPQCFIVSKIKEAFKQPYSPFFTDDATVLEGMDETIYLVEGNPENVKITNPNDLKYAELYL
jgi:2-C-methyl-D-erythritol 4-phosphate cytidylyltransferase